MKRILAACALLMAGLLAGAWATAQVNGSGGVYINGVLQGGVGGSGTVTSVGVTLPAFMNVSGTNPIITSGTFLFGLENVSAGAVFAGPASGADAEPMFRLLATTDLASPDALGVLTSDGAGALSWSAAPATGATTALDNLASVAVNANIVAASNHATDLGTSSLAWKTIYTADLKTDLGRLLGLSASAPAAVAASQAGVGANLTASAATAGTSSAGAAAGGDVTITSGAAARYVSGNANGGDIALSPGAGIGTGTYGIARPSADNILALGSSTYRFTTAFASTGFSIHKAVSDANPTAMLGDGLISFGAGGVSAVDTDIRRVSERVLQIIGSGASTEKATWWVGGLRGFATAGTVNMFEFINTGINLRATLPICWSSGENSDGPFDVCAVRSGVSVLKATNGSTGFGSWEMASVKLFDGGTHYTTLQAQTQAANITLTLPPIANVSGTLRNDGTGSLTWDHNQLVDQFTYTFFDLTTDLPATLDVPSIYVNRARAIHITEVYCEADTADGAVVNLTNAGDTVLDGDLTCTTAGATSTSFVSGKDAVALNAKLSHVMVSVQAGLKRLNVVVKYTVD